MRKVCGTIASGLILGLIPTAAFAGLPVSVPEIDGAQLPIAGFIVSTAMLWISGRRSAPKA